MRYANNSQYKSEGLIRKEGQYKTPYLVKMQSLFINIQSLMIIIIVYVNDIVLEELKRIIRESDIIK